VIRAVQFQSDNLYPGAGKDRVVRRDGKDINRFSLQFFLYMF